ncbi:MULTISPECIES: YtxH domain-containing protein [unclassified Dietzia]|uniref:YtxH domain-containing protein n=1 Tax=unclassified Dietzia TaxID=2617939 RepID=UPI0015FC9BAE|nr:MULTISPECIES: YtxH domain-containing protein [unclassified Dietzia]MBB1052525.1 YtxH domain-containing protein [Dietzia sp. CW19]MBB1054634.1 YtxH domain-containing protein [Dietzia sp. B44]
MSKFTLIAAAAVGYVLGSRAGRGHYEIVKEQATKLWQTPQVQEAASQATEFAKDAAEQVKDQVSDPSGQSGDGPSSDGQSSGGRHSTDQADPLTSQYPPSGSGDGTTP